jgi:ergothioneine biosynthesis protein EgtB
MLELLETISDETYPECMSLIELGLNHEQQHQELLITDIKNLFSSNPSRPVYNNSNSKLGQSEKTTPLRYIEIEGGIYEIGCGADGFSFDNEGPRHKVLVNGFKLQNRLVTNGEYLEFINAGGYSTHGLWLSDGWDITCRENWKSPLYWERLDDEWFIMTLSGIQKLNLSEPVCHVSFYEADAFVRWSKKRLPTEAEWEVAASTQIVENKNSNFLENKIFHPIPFMNSGTKLSQMFGDTWEWTASTYLPYPGYKQPKGIFGEYNGKFMSNQMVLKGGSCATPKDHIRTTYRNFFQCDKRWQFTGIRLASDG